ncbi:MAG: Ni/Fe-hydrogenase, b-type cytochrome subunit [Sporomusaceae bacterium]|jgi:Ni/Fe-hydrogenase 1 B-type cytochrome subunit|nr:Ni/Fe-hydrogenase, b-type cytochrome subunit [Sporomusaceae bacterium]
MQIKQGQMNTKAYYVFSPWLRVFHWIMVICIVVLFVTGLYIADPFFIGTQGMEPTFASDKIVSMSYIRYIHFIAGYVLTVSLILKIYGFITNPGDRLFPKPWDVKYWTGMIDTKLHYLFLRPKHKPYVRNSLARSGYAAVYVMILIQIITGFAMYFAIDPNRPLAKIFSFLAVLGDEYMLHIIHHLVTWAIMLFVIIHIYMAIRADFMERDGEISSMFSGMKYMTEEPDDIEDVIGSKRRKGIQNTGELK